MESQRGSTLHSLDEKVPGSLASHPPASSTGIGDNDGSSQKIATPVDPKKAFVRPVKFTELFRYATKFELFLNAFGIVCAVAAGGAQPMMSLLFGRLTNRFVDFSKAMSTPGGLESIMAEFKHEASMDALYLVVIGLGAYVVAHAYMFIWTYTGEVNSKRIREHYFKAVLRQDIAFFDTLGAGEVATRIQTDTHLIQQGISEKVGIVASYLGAFVTGFVLAYIKSWRAALVLSCILPCIFITGMLMGKFERKYKQLSITSVAEGGTLAEEVISTVRTAQAFGTQTTLSGLYNHYVQAAFRGDKQAAVVRGIAMGVFMFILYSGYALAFYWGTTIILDGYANVGTVVNVFMAILVGSMSLTLMAPEVFAIVTAQAAAGKVFATIDRAPPIDAASESGLKPKNIKGIITFEDVVFHYPSRPNVPILKGLSVTFAAGKTTALVGASGSGKSTIVSLVERFYDPISGTIRLDGVDIKDINVKWLRQQIGLVQQEPALFATTISGNVAHGLIGTQYEHASAEEKMNLIREACIKANADSFIQKLPLGYDTMVGERGFLLSGGQKQRIAIARAIVSDPVILLLDEATSALDTQSEGVVQDALDKAAAGRTTITIAHRLSTVRDADQIFVMGGGEVLEQGTHHSLLATGGTYSQLVQAQMLRGQDQRPDAADDTVPTTSADVQSAMEDEKAALALERSSTTGSGGKSLASEAIEKKKQDARVPMDDFNFPYLFQRMAKINSDAHAHYIMGFIFSICMGMVYPSFGIVFGKAVSAFSETDRHQLRHDGDRNALWFFLIAILAAFAALGQNFMLSSAAANLTAKLRSVTFSAILRQDIGWFDEDKNSTGALVSSLSDNPTKIYGLAGITLGGIVQSSTTVIGGAIIGLIFGPKLAAVGIACIPFVVSAGYIRLRVVVLKDQVNRRAHEESAQMACEAAGAVRTVQALTREDDCFEEYSRSLETPLRKSERSAIFSTGLFAISQSLSYFCIALVFWYGSRLIANGELSTFHFFVCLMSIIFGAVQAGNIFAWVPDMSAAKGAASDIVRLIDQVPEVDAESPDGLHVDSRTIKGHIRFEDVHFRYPTRPGVRVLRNMNLVVEPGTYVALVGASGCGKSTVIQLLERFYDPLAGRVLLDGQDISTLNVQEYRKNLALVSQEPTLYAGTIRFNILLGATKPESEVTQLELEKACRDANILEFIQSLPSGFDTEVGGKGSQLSGGQKQRIAIARALLRNPKVLLLDEATSALDSQSEKVVQAALDNASRGRTTIAIAHRLSTIQNADRIFFFRDGRVAESGTHEELLRLRGGYYELVQLQALSNV